MGLKGILLWSRLHGKQDEKENDIFEPLYEFSEKWKHVICNYFDFPGGGNKAQRPVVWIQSVDFVVQAPGFPLSPHLLVHLGQAPSAPCALGSWSVKWG